jgi:1,4-alpha-glucan branching enzyme
VPLDKDYQSKYLKEKEWIKKMLSIPSRKSTPKTKKTQFQLDAPEARKVALAGIFNEWDINTLPTKKDREGTWPGQYLTPERS